MKMSDLSRFDCIIISFENFVHLTPFFFPVNAQLMWSEDQSRTLLQLYPQILVSHISNGEHQPMEELWLQLAKAYMNATNDRKQCYEVFCLYFFFTSLIYV